MTMPAIAPPERDEPDDDDLLPVVATLAEVGVEEEVGEEEEEEEEEVVAVVVVEAGELEDSAVGFGARPTVTAEDSSGGKIEIASKFVLAFLSHALHVRPPAVLHSVS
jgi:hypothetical protein